MRISILSNGWGTKERCPKLDVVCGEENGGGGNDIGNQYNFLFHIFLVGITALLEDIPVKIISENTNFRLITSGNAATGRYSYPSSY